ncbi:MAG TPA: hypothetical protein VF006_26450 [Longimicrobium sp.]
MYDSLGAAGVTSRLTRRDDVRDGRSEPDDERRIERGAALFDSLYSAASSPGGAG